LALIGQVYTKVSRMYNLVIRSYVIPVVVVHVLTTRLIDFFYFSSASTFGNIAIPRLKYSYQIYVMIFSVYILTEYEYRGLHIHIQYLFNRIDLYQL